MPVEPEKPMSVSPALPEPKSEESAPAKPEPTTRKEVQQRYLYEHPEFLGHLLEEMKHYEEAYYDDEKVMAAINTWNDKHPNDQVKVSSDVWADMDPVAEQHNDEGGWHDLGDEDYIYQEDLQVAAEKLKAGKSLKD